MENEIKPGLIETSRSGDKFRAYAQERETLFAAPFSHNRTLSDTGAVFSITHAAIVKMDASDMDIKRGVPKGTKLDKIVYTCVSQEGWTHTGVNEPDTVYEVGKPFKLSFTPNDIRYQDMERIKEILAEDGIVENLRLQTYKARKAGMSDAHGIVSAHDWTKEAK